jgi:hypothetical protein
MLALQIGREAKSRGIWAQDLHTNIRRNPEFAVFTLRSGNGSVRHRTLGVCAPHNSERGFSLHLAVTVISVVELLCQIGGERGCEVNYESLRQQAN